MDLKKAQQKSHDSIKRIKLLEREYQKRNMKQDTAAAVLQATIEQLRKKEKELRGHLAFL